MDESAVLVLPPLLPCAVLPGIGVTQFLGVADITDRRVKPHVKNLSFSPLYRYRYTPVEVTRHGTWLESAIEPALALSVHVGPPLLMVLENPLLQPRLIVIERQIPVFGLPLHQRIARHHVIGVYQFLGREGTATSLALVAIGSLSVTPWTLTPYVTVRKELPSLFVIILLTLYLHELTVVVEFLEEVRGKLMVGLGGSPRVYVERYTEVVE